MIYSVAPDERLESSGYVKGVDYQVVSDFKLYGKTFYVFEYVVNNEKLFNVLKQEPALGYILTEEERMKNHFNSIKLYKKDGSLSKRAQIIHLGSRLYADTYEEAVKCYNALAKDRMYKLMKLAKSCEDDFIE